MLSTNTEVRKVPTSNTYELAKILDIQDSWKKLMAIIPKNVDTPIEPKKYNIDHIRKIEAASIRRNCSCSIILLDEWGMSGRPRVRRPNIGDLLELLKKAELYRAADYVSIGLLKGPPIVRPTDGPAAPVDISLPPEDMNDIEQLLDQLSYPASEVNLQMKIQDNHDNNKDFYEKFVGKQDDNNSSGFNDLIQFSQTVSSIATDINASMSECDTNAPIIISQTESIYSESGVPKFLLSDKVLSSTDYLPNFPNISALNLQPNEEVYPLPNISALNVQYTDSKESSVPNVSALNMQNNYSSASVSPNLQESGLLSPLPNISALNMQDSDLLSPLPNLSNLNVQTTDSKSNFSSSSSISTQNSELMPPLPDINMLNMKLDSNTPISSIVTFSTNLPHISFNKLQENTNNFDETCYTQNGRKLGSGAFGSVYLAFDLLGSKVAVKKMRNQPYKVDYDPYTIDKEFAIKQFKNEVEIMTKYKHKNLLTLLGYSCDGPSYCLIYEYMKGGSLKDRLQNRNDSLHYKCRLTTALGCARAIDYLHNALDTPLIHRDVKSANILLDCNNEAKLGDFGLIKPSANGSGSNTGTTILGTTAYMAPEALRGDVSVKLDCYSYGVILLELITSLPPMDENRQGWDLVTYIEDHIETLSDGIVSLIDRSAGDWINEATILYDISLKCLQQKRHRPLIKEILRDISTLVLKRED